MKIHWLLVPPVKKQIIFSRFDSDYVLHKGLEFITLLLISPVLFLFPSSHLISILFLTFESSSNHSPLSIFWRASLSTALMQFLLGFMLLLQRNLQVQPNCFQPSKHEAHSFGCSLKVLYQQFPIFVNFSAKKTPSLSCSIIKKFITAVWKPALFLPPFLTLQDGCSPFQDIKQRCVWFPRLWWKTSLVCFWQNGVAAVIQNCWKTVLIK